MLEISASSSFFGENLSGYERKKLVVVASDCRPLKRVGYACNNLSHSLSFAFKEIRSVWAIAWVDNRIAPASGATLIRN